MGGQKELVHKVSDAASVLLQARLPVTSSLLSQAFEVARRAIAVDPQATLQLGSYGIIMQSGTEMLQSTVSPLALWRLSIARQCAGRHS